MNTNKIAIYWDFENIHACLLDQFAGNDEPSYQQTRYSPQPEIINVNAIATYANTLGDVVIHNGYANWQFFAKYRDQLNNAGMQLIQIFPRGYNAKNGADISLALDVITDIQQQPHITHVIVVSNDSDFISVAQKVKRTGKTIIGIGLENANRFWKQSCNEFKHYDLLAKQEQNAIVRKAEDRTEAIPATIEEDEEMIAEHLKRCMDALIEQRVEYSIPRPVLKSALKRMNPSFDEKRFGYASFSALLRNYDDVVVLDGVHNVCLADALEDDGS